MRRTAFSLALVVALLHVFVAAQQVGPNVNVLAGTDPRTGDAFLQRQNEAVVAASTRNPDHLIVAMNDYRTVDIAFDPTIEEGTNGFIARLLGRKAAKRIDAVLASCAKRSQDSSGATLRPSPTRGAAGTWSTEVMVL